MSVSVTKGIWFFRLQIEVPPNGNLRGLIIQICAREVFYEANPDETPNYDKMVAQSPEIAILTLPNPIDLEEKYPGISEAMQLLQFAAISEGLPLMELFLNPPVSESSPAPELVTVPPEVTQ